LIQNENSSCLDSSDDTTPTNLINEKAQIETRTKYITSSTETLSSTEMIDQKCKLFDSSSYVILNFSIQVTSYPFPSSTEYETSSGVSLSHSLYFNFDDRCRTQCYINSITLRLFTNWKDDGLLYLFIISEDLFDLKILRRYAIDPERNTTEWQTIEIPLYALPIVLGNFLAIGMQEYSDTNQIYIVKTIPGMSDTNINEDTTEIYPKFMSDTAGVALTYTVIENGMKIFSFF
jgi:hypothetical protein